MVSYYLLTLSILILILINLDLLKLLIEDDQTTDFIELARDCLSTLSKVSIVAKIKQLRLKIREMESNDENTNELMKKMVKFIQMAAGC